MPVVGEGTYGCVHKPSLKCNTTRKINYTNKISKLMTKKAADEEIKEYSKINKLDKTSKHYLGMPLKCLVENNKESFNEIKQCKKSSKFLENKDKLRLLVMEDGGLNLSDIFNNEFLNYSVEEKIHTCELIFIFLYDIFSSLKFFTKEQVYHRDIKLENIVFNRNERKMSIIDFGFMDSKNNLIKQAISDKYNLGVVWWSLAPYSLFINKNDFVEANILQSNPNLVNKFMLDNKLYNGDQINYFFKRITSKNNIDKTLLRNTLLSQLKNTISYLKKTSHTQFLNEAFPALDVHNLGMVLLELIGYTKEYINNPEFMNELKSLGMSMINFDVYNHITIKQASIKYESILKKSGLLNKNKYWIRDDKVFKIDRNIYKSKKNKEEDYPVDMIFNVFDKKFRHQTRDKEKRKKIYKTYVKKFSTSDKAQTRKNTKVSPAKTKAQTIKNTKISPIKTRSQTKKNIKISPIKTRSQTQKKVVRFVTSIKDGTTKQLKIPTKSRIEPKELTREETKNLRKILKDIKTPTNNISQSRQTNQSQSRQTNVSQSRQTNVSQSRQTNQSQSRQTNVSQSRQTNQSQIKRTNASYALPIGHYINPKTGNLNKLPAGKMISKITGNLINIPVGKNVDLKTGELYDLSPGKKVGKTGKVITLKQTEYLNHKTGRINKLKPGTTYNKTIKKVVSICEPEEKYNPKTKKCESIYGTRPLSSKLRLK